MNIYIVYIYIYEGLRLKLKLQYFGLLMQRTNSLEKIVRRRGRQDEIVGWHHRVNGREFEQTPGDSEGQGSSPWNYEELDTTEPLNNNNNLSVWVCWVFLVVHEISISAACGILVSQPGIEPVSPALQGGFLTIGPPGKSLWDYLYRLETFYLEMS